ncbi:hypothetical protein FHS68_001726 [Dyadobacter arcticus]|uniref:Uncharacterized protein n=1 Tax=Dyadobacter arcticus TaxID=1078754 RepID=A0ABX0UHY3_9BACT|nr:hypothetical protein [Dyadobacter arcticus]
MHIPVYGHKNELRNAFVKHPTYELHIGLFWPFVKVLRVKVGDMFVING